MRVLHSRLRQAMLKLSQDQVVHQAMLDGRLVIVWQIRDKDKVDTFITALALYYLRPWRPTLAVLTEASAETRSTLISLPTEPHLLVSKEVVEKPLLFHATCTECWSDTDRERVAVAEQS